MNVCERRPPVEKTHIKQNIYLGITCILLMTTSTIQNINAKTLESGEQSLEKPCRRKKSWPYLRNCPGVCLKILKKKNTRNLRQTCDLGLEKAPPEYMPKFHRFSRLLLSKQFSKMSFNNEIYD